MVHHAIALGRRWPGGWGSGARLVQTVIAPSDGGDTAMRVLGHEEPAFTGEAGSGI